MEILKFILASVISAVVIIVLAKIVLQKLIRVPADYYLEDELDQDYRIMEKVDREYDSE